MTSTPRKNLKRPHATTFSTPSRPVKRQDVTPERNEPSSSSGSSDSIIQDIAPTTDVFTDDTSIVNDSVFSEEEHAQQDAEILAQPTMLLFHMPTDTAIQALSQMLSGNDPFQLIGSVAVPVFTEVINRAHGKLNTDLTGGPGQQFYNTLNGILGHEQVVALLKDALTSRSFSQIRNLPLLRKQPSASSKPGLSSQQEAIVHHTLETAWQTPIRGTSSNLLWSILKDYAAQTQARHYARYTTFCQSSGTGKSRMIDELSKEVVCVPINLTQGGASAFPPGDLQATHILQDVGQPINQEAYQKKIQGFIYGLLVVTKARLEEIEKEYNLANSPNRRRELANHFRSKMTAGMAYLSHNDYRKKFYAEVATLTEEFRAHADERESQVVGLERSPSKPFAFKRSGQSRSDDSAAEAASSLCAFIRNDSKHRVRQSQQKDPQSLHPDRQKDLAVVLSFDEAHKLAEDIENATSGWTRFSELRRGLRLISKSPIFSIFLSTAGKFHMFSPDPLYDSSYRLQGQHLLLFPPITETGFDDFARKVALDGTWTLDRLASTDQIAHLGRALFAAQYDSGADSFKDMIVDYARVKLLSAPYFDQERKDHTLACLAPRLCLDFRASTWLEREMERTQVERHMRLCLSALAGFQKMTTISPSEPLLAEAAYEIMRDNIQDPWPSQALSLHMQHSFLDPGTRGEVVAALLLLLARDRATEAHPAQETADVPQFDDKHPVQERHKHDGYAKCRIITVVAFLTCLIASQHSSWQHLKPSVAVNGIAASKTLPEAFVGCYIWFNHFIKLYERNTLSVDYLWRVMVRGAAIICAVNQQGIDILIPYLRGNVLKKENIGVILIQVKNDKTYKTAPLRYLFDAMDPVALGIYEPDGPQEEDTMDEDEGSDDEDAEAADDDEEGDETAGPATASTPDVPVLRIVFALASEESAVTHPPTRRRRSARVSPKAKNQPKFSAYDVWLAGASHETFAVMRSSEETHYQYLLERSKTVLEPYFVASKLVTQPTEEAQSAARRRMHPAAAAHTLHYEKYIQL